MASRITELGSYSSDIARAYNWKINIPDLPQFIKDKLFENYPKMMARIGATPGDVPFPVNAFCTTVLAPPTTPDTIVQPIGDSSLESFGVFSNYSFTATFVSDSNLDIYNLFQSIILYSLQATTLRDKSFTMYIYALDNKLDSLGKKKIVTTQKSSYTQVKRLTEIQYGSDGVVVAFTVGFTTPNYDREDL